jgi:RimJ/RimL family protein N-acetyltransferase
LHIDKSIRSEEAADGNEKRKHHYARAMLIHTQRLRLLTCEEQHLAAIATEPGSLGELLGIAIPEHWPEHRQAYRHARNLLKKNPLVASSGWWLYLFVEPVLRTLVGSGGFKAAPDTDGVVEIGCDIAPAYRRQGYATEAMRGLIRYAFSRSGVNAVQAYSLPRKCPQSDLLRGLGMQKVGEARDAVAGTVWRWRITRDAYLKLALCAHA